MLSFWRQFFFFPKCQCVVAFQGWRGEGWSRLLFKHSSALADHHLVLGEAGTDLLGNSLVIY